MATKICPDCRLRPIAYSYSLAPRRSCDECAVSGVAITRTGTLNKKDERRVKDAAEHLHQAQRLLLQIGEGRLFRALDVEYRAIGSALEALQNEYKKATGQKLRFKRQ
jgi:hypothetical protein